MAERGSRRLYIMLDAERAAKLAQLAARTHISEASLARQLLTRALDDADTDARSVAALLDRIPGAFERAQMGRKQARAGRTIELDEL